MNAHRTLTALALAAAAVLVPLAVGGCSDDDNPTTPAAEARTFTLTLTNVAAAGDFFAGGVFDTPLGKAAAGPAFPGDAFEFTFGARPGDRLYFATMFAQSNDCFYAPAGGGIALYDGMGQPLGGDVTGQVALWDAGTEMNQAPGAGDNQAPRQAAPDTGPADANTAVRLVDDGYAYPAVASVIGVIVTPLGDGLFRARIEARSTASTLMVEGGGTAPVPLSPGVFVVTDGGEPLFTAGMPDLMQGLEHIAEDGNPMMLGQAVEARTSLVTPLAPGVAVVHTTGAMLFSAGMPDPGLGLEALAEDASPGALAASVDGAPGVRSVMVFDTPVGASMPGPIFPGGSFTVTFRAEPGDRLSFASMFGQSNDLFYAFGDAGLDLFDAMGMPVTGDVTGEVSLWDAGTEANQWPGVGPDQAPRQAGPNTGAADPIDTVRPVADGFAYPMTDHVIRVTLSAAP